MSYYFVKTLHIFCASILLLSLCKCCLLWYKRNFNLLTKQGWMILFISIFQLFSGFTMISLKHTNVKQLWIQGSIVGFILFISCCILFFYLIIDMKTRIQPSPFLQKTISVTLSMMILTMLSMIFFMASQYVIY